VTAAAGGALDSTPCAWLGGAGGPWAWVDVSGERVGGGWRAPGAWVGVPVWAGTYNPPPGPERGESMAGGPMHRTQPPYDGAIKLPCHTHTQTHHSEARDGDDGVVGVDAGEDVAVAQHGQQPGPVVAAVHDALSRTHTQRQTHERA
jgi:hypothetical protein